MIIGIPTSLIFSAQDQVLWLPSVEEHSLLSIQVIGAGTLTLRMEDSFDGGVTFAPFRFRSMNSGVGGLDITAAGFYRQAVGGRTVMPRIRCTVFTSGTLQVFGTNSSVR